MKRIIILNAVIILIATTLSSNAQVFRGKEATSRVPGSELLRYTDANSNPDYIKLSDGN
jgi:hypothetical protein